MGITLANSSIIWFSTVNCTESLRDQPLDIQSGPGFYVWNFFCLRAAKNHYICLHSSTKIFSLVIKWSAPYITPAHRQKHRQNLPIEQINYVEQYSHFSICGYKTPSPRRPIVIGPRIIQYKSCHIWTCHSCVLENYRFFSANCWFFSAKGNQAIHKMA